MIATAEMLTAGAAARAAGFAAAETTRVPQAPRRLPMRPDELVSAINGLLSSRPDCEGLEVEAGDLVPGLPDVDGCNWGADGLRLRVAHGPSTRAVAGVRQAVELARLRYELLDG